MILGIDISTYFDMVNNHKKFYKDGKEVNIFVEFKKNGVDHIRIRLWLHPYDKDNNPYAGGTCDFNNFVKLAKLATSYGFKVMLDFHYSDFWCDPSKQTKPKEWEDLHGDELVDALYKYTVETLKNIRKEGIELSYIQVGNETTNGMLWPDGKLIEDKDDLTKKRENYPYLARLLSAGSKGCREIYPETKLIIHLEKSNDNRIYNEYMNSLKEYNVDFDILGVSYYPYWHGSFDELFYNLDDMKKYGKDIMIVETGYGFTLDDYKKFIKDGTDSKILIDEEFLKSMKGKMAYPLSKKGQKEFITKLIELSKLHDIKGIFYWEPCWLIGDNIMWASKAGLKYIHEEYKTSLNEWANQCLFDYEGNMNEGFNAFKK